MQQQLVRRGDIPQPSVGAPVPFSVSPENQLSLFYYKEVETRAPDKVVVLRFKEVIVSKLGHPSETLQYSHPLAKLGLENHYASEVLNSEWLVSENARAGVDKHFIILFHDSTFEVIASSFEVFEINPADLPEMVFQELEA